jgi:preprotein translocase subunit SecF
MANTSFKIIEKKNLWFSISIILIGIGIALMTTNVFKSKPMMNYGIDFVGGSTMILKFEELNKRHEIAESNNESAQAINIGFIKAIRNVLTEYGLESSSVQITRDKEVLIKTLEIDDQKSLAIFNALQQKLGAGERLELYKIGATIGAELRETSIWIIGIVSVALLLYITWRFEFVYGIAALIALLHDALISISFAALLNIEITTAFVAALLTVLGYSINDTIVIFDRIRENIKLLSKKKLPLKTIANISLNQTLVRTLNTSATTLMVISSLLVLGGTTIKGFCLVLLIGIISGTYSSLFIASPLLVMLYPEEK